MSYEYPNVSDDLFQIDLHHKKEYLDYQTYPDNIKNKVSFFPENYALFPHQIFVKHFMSPSTPYRNLLLYHSTGSGKTCSTIQITEQYKDQIRKYRNKTYIITSERLKRVFQEELVKKSCTRGTYDGDAINSKYSEYRRYYEFTTYAIFYKKIDDLPKKLNNKKRVYNELQEEYSNRMIVVDEFQNYKSIATDKNSKKGTDLTKKKRSVSFRNTFLKMLLLSNNSKLLLLSATPIVDGIEDLRFIINAFNALKMRTEFKDGKIICYGEPLYINEKNSYFEDFYYEEEGQSFPTAKDFKKKFHNNNKLNVSAIEDSLRGQISYIKKSFDIKVRYTDKLDDKKDGIEWTPFSDFSSFPYRIVTTNMSFIQKRALMEMVQQKGKYNWQLMSTIMPNEMLNYDDEKEKNLDYDEDYFKLTDLSDEDCNECIDGMYSISHKFGKLMKYIKIAEERNEKVFISTDLVTWILERPDAKDRNGNKLLDAEGKPKKLKMRPFLKHLLEVNGYKEYTYSQFKQDRKNGEGINLDQDIKGYYIVVTGDTTDSIDFINKTFNKKKNKYGKMFRILIGTSAINEGVSLKAVRQTHLLYINNNYSMETMIQIFGRAVRGDSHDQLKPKERHTRRYIHMHTYNDHDTKIQFKLNEFKEIQDTFFKYHEADEEDNEQTETDNKKKLLPDNLTILKMMDNIKDIFDPKGIMKDEYDDENESQEEVMKAFDRFFNYEYFIFEKQLAILEDEYKEHIEKFIPNKEAFDNLKKSLYERLLQDYKSFIYYPYDLYSYLLAFTKYIRNKKILNIFIQIAVDCNLNKESNKVPKCRPNIEEIGEVIEDTYKHEHNVSKLEYIMDSIKKLFEIKKYYKYDDIIDYFLKNKEPDKVNLPTYIDQEELPTLVDLALKEMVPNETIDITIFPHKVIHKGEIGYISHKGNIVSFQNAIGVQYANMKHETLLKKEEYLTDIFTNIKYGIDEDVVYITLEEYFDANQKIIEFTNETEPMRKIVNVTDEETSESEEVSD